MIYIIDEGSRSALQSLEQNFPWYAPYPLPPHPNTTTTPTPTAALSSLFFHPSLHSFLLPYALPLERCFIPHQLPFIPLQPFGLLSFHPSISQTLHLYFHCIPPHPSHPPFTYSPPPPIPRSKWVRNMWPERWEPAGPPPAVPPFVDLSPPVPYWFCFKQGKNTRRMRCRRWHEKKKEVRGEEREKRKSASMYQIYELGPACVQGITRRLLHRGQNWKRREHKRRDGVKMERVWEPLFNNLSFFFISTLYFVRAKWVLGLTMWQMASHSTSWWSSCLKMILCLVQFKLCAE